MTLAFITADKIGLESGGGKVTLHESQALASLGETLILGHDQLQSAGPEPWKWDSAARNIIWQQYVHGGKKFRLAHFYAGTFSQTAKLLKSIGCKISWTIAAHDVAVSRMAHEEVGLPFNYPHLVIPELWRQYIEGYQAADLVICPSQIAKDIVRKYPCYADIEVIPHGCEIPEKVAPLPKRFTVGYMGSFGADKSVVTLLRAWKKLNYKDALLVLAGRDSASEWAAHLVRTHGGGAVTLAGWVKDIAEFYAGISLYVQPSLCLLPGTPVFTERGPLPIEQLSSEDFVLTNDGTWQRVIKPLRRSMNGPMCAIRATGIGLPVYMTPEHRVLAIRRGLDTRKKQFFDKCAKHAEAMKLRTTGLSGDKIAASLGVKKSTVYAWVYYGAKPEGLGANHSLREDVLASTPEWVVAGSLEVGDVLAFPRIKESVPLASLPLPRKVVASNTNRTTPLPSNFFLDSNGLRFLGYYVSEGCANGLDVAFCFHKEEVDYIQEVRSLAADRLGLKSRLSIKDNKATVWIHSSLLSRFLISHFGRGAHGKTLPHWALMLPDSQLIDLLQGAWRGDGSVFFTKTGRLGASYSTVSRSLAYQMFLAMVKLGYMAKVGINKERGYQVGCGGVEASKFARNVLGIETNYHGRRPCPITWIDQDYYYVPVRSITQIEYQGDVWNLEVEGNHCYAAPFIVHNSEGFGCEVVEALAHGRPVICSTGAGAADVVYENWVFPAGDVAALCRLIDKWKNAPPEAYGQSWEQIRTISDYAWPAIRSRYVEAWRRLLA